jgi:phosphate transport system substrate-binding protein
MKKRGILLGSVAATLALAVAGVAGAATTRAADDSLTGAGSSFVYPLVSSWTSDYGSKAGINITYGPVGSGGGIAAIQARTVDFGASDAPLTPDQAAACKECVQIPWALSATAVIYNIPGVKNNLHITGPIVAGIYLGQIKKWNDPKITSLNPGVSLPDLDITPVYRSDGSGTSYNFTDYLSKVSPDFASKIGKSTQPAFSTGLGARGTSGVTGVVARTQGAVTYADVAYALRNRQFFFAVQNQAGAFRLPGIKQITAAASTITGVPADNAISIVDPPKTNKDAYPIGTFSWIIVPKKSAKAKTVKQFILYAISPLGQKRGLPLIFAPLPKVVAVAANKTVAQISQG